MGDLVATVGPPPNGGQKTTLVLLQTRCGCTQALHAPSPPPKTITVQLEPVPGDEKGIRVFYNTKKMITAPNGTQLLLYVEGPGPEKSRIIVPGTLPPSMTRGSIKLPTA